MTFLLPTKAQMLAYTVSPALLKKDKELVNYLTNINDFDLLTKMYDAWANGDTTLVYTASTQAIATTIKTYLAEAPYSYTVTDPAQVIGTNKYTISISWTA
jgi:uncharacterized protein YbaP (TraB family)